MTDEEKIAECIHLIDLGDTVENYYKWIVPIAGANIHGKQRHSTRSGAIADLEFHNQTFKKNYKINIWDT